MTDDTIIKLAREAGFDPETQTLPPFDGFIRRFAELVAAGKQQSIAAEMERLRNLAATAEKWRGIASAKHGDGRTVQEIQREAAEVEREACAQVAEKETARDRFVKAVLNGEGPTKPCKVAAAIRARGAAPKGGES